jgi:hypothetical protein
MSTKILERLSKSAAEVFSLEMLEISATIWGREVLNITLHFKVMISGI